MKPSVSGTKKLVVSLLVKRPCFTGVNARVVLGQKERLDRFSHFRGVFREGFHLAEDCYTSWVVLKVFKLTTGSAFQRLRHMLLQL